MERLIEVPENIEIEFQNGKLKVKGELGELVKEFIHPKVHLEIRDKKIFIKSEDEKRKTKAVVGTWAAHIRNMFIGVTKGWEAKMKIVYSHFPMKVVVEDGKLLIQNFMGERKPRTAKLLDGVKVEVTKDEIKLTGIDKEKVGQTCGNIEIATKVRNRDRRVFQDGIYIVQKPITIE